VFEAFRTAFPAHELQREATKQVAFVYRQSGQLARAAGEYDRVAAESQDPALRGEALLVAGDLYEQSKEPVRALDSYVRYVQEFPHPVETALETRFRIAEIRKAAHDEAGYHRELEEIVRADAEAGTERSVRTRTLAARSGLVLAEKLYGEFGAVKLTQPFETSLQVKQQRMEGLIAALERLVGYGIADVTAAATFYIAETYADFGKSLLESERPADLAAADLEQYEMDLEEEAFPFEEKTIAVHEKNLELLRGGLVNDWTGKSLGRLAELMPGRYARNELSGGFLGSIDIYAYRSPASLLPVAVPGTTEAAPAPTPTDATPAPVDATSEPAAQTTQVETQIDAPTAQDGRVANANPL
jgi:hypothetical protein